MLTTEDFIRKGYFPKELIPPFDTNSLADILPTILKEDLGKFNPKVSKCSLHTIPVIKNVRRHMSIPNPLHQIILSKILADNWSEIESFVLNSKLSLSTPKIIMGSKRAITRSYKISQLPVETIMRSTDSRFMLKTDISRFYSTIYTHSIPWAYHTKSKAKARKLDPSLLGNIIDKCVRNTCDGQTLGIPVGPDSSLIIAEIIGTAIDKKLCEDLVGLKGYRYVDDFYLFFNNVYQAEEALSKIHSITKDFELEINPNKTKIIKLPESIYGTWTSELSLYKFRTAEKEQLSDILYYFSKAFDYSKQFPNEHVLKYSLARIKKEQVQPNNWPLYESLILKSIVTIQIPLF
ncbi:MAG: RNA-directed DNA polymerase [Euryarchaeota archaeon]|nr:RNA-directed DNA polymerase [Euryarchaeota archaeon]